MTRWNGDGMSTAYAFDLDGTVTMEETLPLLAKELGLWEEMRLLTELTLEGRIAFVQSFRLRYHILRNIPVETIQKIMREVRLDPAITAFIQSRKEDCAVVTGNLDVWIAPIVEKLGCRFYSSRSHLDERGMVVLDSILDKGEVVRTMKKTAGKVVAIGESVNDIPMFEEADAAVSYGGVHPPVPQAISVSDYVVFEGGALCRLLKML